MSDERDLQAVERALRAAGAPPQPPPELALVARRAALTEPEAEVVRLPHRPRGGVVRAALAAAVIAVSAAGALLIGVGGDQMEVEHTLALQGGGGATGEIKIGKADGGVRELAVTVDGLDPAPEGHYYEVWMSDGEETMALVAFDTGEDGSADMRSAMPAKAGWARCWITLEGGGVSSMVLRNRPE